MTSRSGTKRYRVVVTPGAGADLDEIAAAIAIDSPSNAARFVARLRTAIKHLDRLPSRGARAPEGEVDGYLIRHLIVREYRILYAVAGSQVVIVGVRHGKRLPIES